jgi:GTP-binding protein
VAFDKNKGALGVTGGSGGRGGSVYIEGITDLGALRNFRNRKDWKAVDGKDGRGQWRDGTDGDDVVLKVPVGTVVHNLETGESSEVTTVGERIRLAKGGRGGRGNFHFKSSTNTSPEEFEEGKPGEEFDIRLELKLIADVGFVGLPNVGKSSLLNELTNANVKVANYQFTTLEPNLGVYYELVLADIPGLIEGASEGKGLGIKFLKHVERTGILFHFIAADSETPLEDHRTIRKELTDYSPKLAEKEEYLFISRSDEASPERVAEIAKLLKKETGKEPMVVSVLDDSMVERVRTLLSKISNEKIARA